MSVKLGETAKTTRRRQRKPIALSVPSDVRLRVSPEDFWRLCMANDLPRLERTSKGVLIVMAPAASGTGMRNASLVIRLGRWAEDNGTGVVFDSSAGFTLPNSAVRSPDASWILRERWESLIIDETEKFSPICPDFVIELRSRTDSLSKLRETMREYVAQGVRLGWMLDPKRNVVEIYRPGRQVETLEHPTSLSGEDVLPGFVLDLSGILVH